MANPIRDIVTFLDALIDSNLGFQGVQYHGLTELVEGGIETFPVPERQGKSKRISIDMRYPLQIYHRINGPISETESPDSFGKSRDYPTTATVSLFGIGIQKLIEKAYRGINTDVAFQIFDGIPREGFRISDTIQLVNLVGPSIIQDKDVILNSEFRGNGSVQKHKLDIVAFRIDYTIQADICDNACGGEFDITANCADVVVEDGLDTVNLRPGDNYTCTSGGSSPVYDETFFLAGGGAVDEAEFVASASFQLTSITAGGAGSNPTITADAVLKSVGDTINHGQLVRVMTDRTAPTGTAQVRVIGDLVTTTVPFSLYSYQYGVWTDLVNATASNPDNLSVNFSGLTNQAGTGSNATARLDKVFIQNTDVIWVASKGITCGFRFNATAPTSPQNFDFAIQDGGTNVFIREGAGTAYQQTRGGFYYRINISGDQVNYYIDNTLVYTSATGVTVLDEFYFHVFYSGSNSEIGVTKVGFTNIRGVQS